MKLSKIRIHNYRKLHDVEVNLGDATFLIGANNSGKTSTLSAIEYLLTSKKLEPDCRSKFVDAEGEEQIIQEDVNFCSRCNHDGCDGSDQRFCGR